MPSFSPHPCISRQRAFLSPPGNARPDWWIISRVASRMGFGAAFSYDSPRAIFDEHARLSAAANHQRRAFDIGGLAGLPAGASDTGARLRSLAQRGGMTNSSIPSQRTRSG